MLRPFIPKITLVNKNWSRNRCSEILGAKGRWVGMVVSRVVLLRPRAFRAYPHGNLAVAMAAWGPTHSLTLWWPIRKKNTLKLSLTRVLHQIMWDSYLCTPDFLESLMVAIFIESIGALCSSLLCWFLGISLGPNILQKPKLLKVICIFGRPYICDYSNPPRYLTSLIGFSVCIQLHFSFSLSDSIFLIVSFCLH